MLIVSLVGMTAEELKRLLGEFNAATLGELVGKAPGGGKASVVVAGGVATLVGRLVRGLRDFRGGAAGGCHTSLGSFAGHVSLDGDAVAVGAVLDQETADCDDDLPVVLAVGINYGQGKRYLGGVRLVDDTQMRPQLNQHLAYLETTAAVSGLPYACKVRKLDGYHLIAANLFPWITTKPWVGYGFNSISEAAILNGFGHDSIDAYLSKLISTVKPAAVVFHGANNAVAYQALSMVRNRLVPRDVEVILCDNIDAWSGKGRYRAKTRNAIALIDGPVTKSELRFDDFDE